jgi:hypothetical protein
MKILSIEYILYHNQFRWLALKSVYCCLIRSICEYGSIISSPYQSGHKHNIEEIQHKFLRFLSFKCSIFREPHSSFIDCPEFLSRFSFYALYCNSRSKNTFYLNTEVTNYASNTPHLRIMKTINKLNIDMFISPNFNAFKLYFNLLLVNSEQ